MKAKVLLIVASWCLALGAQADDKPKRVESKQLFLFIHETTYELDGKSYSTDAELEAALRSLKPTSVRFVLDKDVKYERAASAMEAIQRVGGIDIGLRGNEHR